RVVALGDDADELVAAHHEQRTDVVIRHQPDRREHGIVGCDRKDTIALVGEEVSDLEHAHLRCGARHEPLGADSSAATCRPEARAPASGSMPACVPGYGQSKPFAKPSRTAVSWPVASLLPGLPSVVSLVAEAATNTVVFE